MDKPQTSLTTVSTEETLPDHSQIYGFYMITGTLKSQTTNFSKAGKINPNPCFQTLNQYSQLINSVKTSLSRCCPLFKLVSATLALARQCIISQSLFHLCKKHDIVISCPSSSFNRSLQLYKTVAYKHLVILTKIPLVLAIVQHKKFSKESSVSEVIPFLYAQP